MPVEYTFDKSGFFCTNYSDAEEWLSHSDEADVQSKVYLVQSNRCVFKGILPDNKIENISLIKIIRRQRPDQALCKVRIYAGGEVGEGWAGCEGLLKGGTELFITQDKETRVIRGWGGYRRDGGYSRSSYD